MIPTLTLIAQLAGPPCGYWLGTEVTPTNDAGLLTGCVINDQYSRPQTRLRYNPFTPSGMQAEPPLAPTYGQ